MNLMLGDPVKEKQPLPPDMFAFISLIVFSALICLLLQWVFPGQPSPGYLIIPLVFFGYGGRKAILNKCRPQKRMANEFLQKKLPSGPMNSTPEYDLAMLAQKELRNLVPGLIVFNVSDHMTVGKKESVDVRITTQNKGNIDATLHGFNELPAKEIKIGPVMKTKLQGESFSITSINSEEQVIPASGYAEWKWRITPEASGHQTLLLIVTVTVKFLGSETNYDVEVLEKSIKVKADPVRAVKSFFVNKWEWIIGTAVGGGWLVAFLENKFGDHAKH